MSCNYIYIKLKNKNYINFNKNQKKIFGLSIGNGISSSKAHYASNKNDLGNIFKFKTNPALGYINQYFEIIYNKKFAKKNNAKMIYKTNEINKDIKIFNPKFISNNMKRAKLIINNKQYYLKEIHSAIFSV